MGGNLLLDIGPKADGTIPEEQVAILKESQAPNSIRQLADQIPSTKFRTNPKTQIPKLKIKSKIAQSPNRHILLKGILNKINTIWVVGNGTKLEQTTWLKPWWSGNPGLTEIEIPAEAMDTEMTVIAVLLDGKIRLKF